MDAPHDGTMRSLTRLLQLRATRRGVIHRAMLLGLATPVVAGLLGACGSSSSTSTSAAVATSDTSSGAAASTTSATTTGNSTASSGNAQASPGATTAGAASGPAKKGGIASVAVTASPTSWDLLKSDWITWQSINYLYDRLIDVDDKETPKPMLATSWDVTPDGLTYTLKLRSDVKFHDGTPFNSQSVKFNIERYLNKEDSAFYTEYEAVSQIDLPDDQTVKLTLKQVSVSMLFYLADWGAIQVSPAVEQKLGDNYSSQPTGTGPFQFKDYVADSHIDYVRNESYWQTPAALDGIQIKIIPEPNVELDNLQAKTIDIMYGVNPKDVDSVKKLGATVEAIAVPGAQFISMNLTQAPTSELAVRKAIARAVNRDEMIKKLLYGYAVKARAGASPGSPYYFDDVPMIEYDPDAAGKLLDDAGWKMGSNGIRERDGQPLSVSLLSTTFQDWSLYNQVIQEQLKAIGIDSKISSLEWGTYLDTWRENKGGWNVTYHSQGSVFASTSVIEASWYPDAYWNICQIGKSTDPQIQQLSKQLQSIYDQIQTTLDLDKRKQLAKQAQQLYQDNQLTVWLWHGQSITGLQPYLKDYQLTWHGRLVGLDTAWLDK